MKIIYVFLFVINAIVSVAQTSNKSNLDLIFELQVYPNGIIPGLDISYSFNDFHQVEFRFGYRAIHQSNVGLHEKENGDGWGFSIGYNHYLKKQNKGLCIGIRNDIWYNAIEWQDGGNTDYLKTGRTETTVLQPSFITGYAFFLSKYRLIPTIAYGFEVNINTLGRDVSQGAIMLFGIKIGKRVKNKKF